MPDCDRSDIKNWKAKVKEEQQYLCDRLGDREYDLYTSQEIKYLELKILFAFYGLPDDVDENANELEPNHYSKEKREYMEKVRDLILSKCEEGNVLVAFIYLCVKQFADQYKLPFIRIKDSKENVLFIDQYLRVYTSWHDFTEHNEMPKCIYCYPENGIYSTNDDDEVNLGFRTTSRCNIGEQIIVVTDIAGTVSTIGSMVLGGISFFVPPTAPILVPVAMAIGIGGGGYVVGRTTYKLADRGIHDQSINPFTDAAALNLWLTCVGGALALGTTGVLKYVTHLAKKGHVACKFVRISYSILEIGSQSVNGLGFVCHLVTLANKDKITITDVMQFSASVLFFTHTVCNLKTASTIIKNVQGDVLNNYKNSWDANDQKQFDKILKKTIGNKKMHGNATVIKGLKKINNLEEFFKDLKVIHEDANENHDVKLTDKGLIKINDQLVLHPTKYASIKSDSRSHILNCTKKLQNSEVSVDQFQDDVAKICKEERLHFEVTRKQTRDAMCKRLEVTRLDDFKLNGKKVFKSLQPHQVDRLTSLDSLLDETKSNDLLKASVKFSEKIGCNDTSDFSSHVEFLHGYANEIKKTFASLPRKERLNAVLNQMNEPNSNFMDDAVNKFNDIKVSISQLNENAKPGFASNNLATYHYYKHKTFNKEDLSPDQYFELMEDLFQNGELPAKKSISQEGDKIFVNFEDRSTGAMGVIIEPVVKSDTFDVIAATFFYNKRVHDA